MPGIGGREPEDEWSPPGDMTAARLPMANDVCVRISDPALIAAE
jgi:hypothetical protein